MTLQSPTAVPTPGEAAVQEFAQALRERLVRPSDPDYDSVRQVYNGMIDRKPGLIARCADVANVVTAVNFAREHGLLVAIRGGGHNVAGLGTCDNGLVIDLSRMRGIRVDPAAKTVRVGAGCTWGDLDHATHAFGLATPAGLISTTGVAGLTLGGGFGHLSRHYGLTCDNLLSADIVTADGQFHTVDNEHEPHLFWAIRGGGGNFGVVTSFEFQLHPVSLVYGGPIFYPMERAEQLLRFYRDFMRQAPNELSAFFSMQQAPPAPFIPDRLHFAPIIAIVVCYSGDDPNQAETLLRPLREVVKPISDLAGPIPYPMLNSLFDSVMPPGLQQYWKADYVPELTDAAIVVHTEYGSRVPSLQSTMHLYPQSGAIQRVGRQETAYSHRDVEYIHIVAAIDADPANMPKNMAWMQSYYDALRPHSAAGGYVNMMMDNEGQARVKAAYGDNYERLVAIKARYDPTNLFRVNQNIKPTA